MIGRVLVTALAGERLRRAWQDEIIGEPIRRRLFAYTSNPSQARTRKGKRDRARREFVEDLTTCPHCLGFWLTVVAAFGLRIRWSRPIIEALAGAVILSTIVERLGWTGKPADVPASE